MARYPNLLLQVYIGSRQAKEWITSRYPNCSLTSMKDYFSFLAVSSILSCGLPLLRLSTARVFVDFQPRIEIRQVLTRRHCWILSIIGLNTFSNNVTFNTATFRRRLRRLGSSNFISNIRSRERSLSTQHTFIFHS